MASSPSIKTAPDEEMLESRPYISTDHTAAMENSADMYYDPEWHYPETELQKYKYVFGKIPGTHITARHVIEELHEYYATYFYRPR